MKACDAVRSDRGTSTGPSIWAGHRRRSQTGKMSDWGDAERGGAMGVGVSVGIAIVVWGRSAAGAAGVVGGVGMGCCEDVETSSVGEA